MLSAVDPDGGHGSDGDVEEGWDGVRRIDGHEPRVEACISGGGANLDAGLGEGGLSDGVVFRLEFWGKSTRLVWATIQGTERHTYGTGRYR